MSSSEHGVLKIVLELEPFVNTENSTFTTSEKRSCRFFSFLYLLLILFFHNATPLSGGGDGEKRRRERMTLQEHQKLMQEIKRPTSDCNH